MALVVERKKLTTLLPQALEGLRVQQGVEVDGPADAKGLRQQELRGVFIPKRVTQSIKRGEAEVIGNAENSAMPGSLLGRSAQLVSNGCT